MFHASGPNSSTNRRVGVVIRFITPAAKQTRVDEDYATLVCGADQFSHFKEELIPNETMAPEAVVFHERVAELRGRIYLTNTGRAGVLGLVETNAISD